MLQGREESRRSSRGALWVAFLIFAWYVSSSMAVLLTKWLFSGAEDGLEAFPFGLTVTATNNVVAWVISALVVESSGDALRESNGRRLAIVIGSTTGAEIGLSNIALSLLSVSYATVLKGMAPLFVMAWGAFLGLHPLRLTLVTSMSAIVGGVILAVAGESEGNVSHFARIGFIAQLGSALFAGFRWVLTQVFMKGELIANDWLSSSLNLKPLSRPVSSVETIRCTVPFTLGALIPAIVLLEGVQLVQWVINAEVFNFARLIAALFLVGCCVYVLLWAEYELVKATSSLTVSVAFVLKEVLVICASRVLFGDSLTRITVTGFVVVQVGLILYAIERRTAAGGKSAVNETVQL